MSRFKEQNWQEKCLMIIEEICVHKCICLHKKKDEVCFPCEIYVIAHVGTAGCAHPAWDTKVNKLWKEFNK